MAPAMTRSASVLRVRVAGRFAVERDGRTIDEGHLGSRKARLLLKLLAAHRGHLVAMDDIVDVLWGADLPANAEANVATLVSRLRGVLGPGTIVGGRRGYRLQLGPVLTLDVDEAADLVDEAEHRLASRQPALALTAAKRSIEMLAVGTVLEDEPGAEWAMDLRRDVERMLRRARVVAWQAHADVGDHRAALAVAQGAIDADALDEEAHRAVMLCYHRLGEQGEALRAYERLRTVLLDELGADPGPETAALFSSVLRGEDVTELRRTEAARSAEPDFVGRDLELRELLDRWADASRGSTSCVLITGEAGIGKSRLAAEFGAAVRATGATLLRARCYEAERSLFLQPFVEVIREAMSTLSPDVVRRAAGERGRSLAGLVPELAAILGDVDKECVVSENERRRTFEAVAQLVAGLARARPLLVVLDDLHEAGASTVEMLHFALRWDVHAPFMMVATIRTGEGDDAREQLDALATTLELPALTDDAVRALADRAGLSDQADAITAKTRGHTLFVVEALRALADAAGGEDPASPKLPVPRSLRDAVTERARRCGPDVEELLRAAVVVGSAFDVALLAEVLGISGEEVVRRAEPARRAGLLVEAGGGYEFSNDLVRDVLYDTTPRPLRIIRHRRLAWLLADQPEAAANHAAVAGDSRLAVTQWLAAADRAAASFANREADQLLTLALETCEALNDDRVTAMVRLARGRARLALGHYHSASEDLLEAEQLAHALGAGDIEATALTERGWAAYHAREIPLAEGLADRAVANPLAGARAAILVGRVRNARGNLDGSVTMLQTVSAEAGEPADRAFALSCLGTALAHSDRYDEAMPILEEAVAACRRTGVLRGMLNARMFGGIVLANLGRFASALTWAEQVVADAERFDAAYYHPRALNTLALIWRELGDPSRARDLAEEALDTSSTSDGEVESEPAANALLALAESALGDGDEAKALGHLDEIRPLLSDRVAYAWRIELRCLEIYARVDRSRAEELSTLARQFGSAKYQALALAHLGATDAAVAVAQQTGSAWLLARVGPEAVARQSAEELAGLLPAGLRDGFVTRGPLLRRWRDS
jgi:DNA-binding SARP family transcriptional activator